MDKDDYKNFLKNNIYGSSDASGGKFIVCKCFECPDSNHSKTGHFYISIPQTDHEYSWYYCHKCGCTGVVSHKILINWGIYDDKIALDLINHNKIVSKNPKTRKLLEDRDVYTLYNNFITEDALSESKLNYFNNRLGLNLGYQELLDMKIVLNVNDLITSNNLALSREPYIVNDIDQNFMGFISLDNAFVNMRRLVPAGKVYKNIDLRYLNYSLFNKSTNIERFYTIPKNINLETNKPIEIHIAEGPFDITSIYYNLRNQSNNIFTCVAGSNYKGILRHFITTLRLPNLEIHLYPDNDKFGSNEVMNDIKNYISTYRFPIYVHRNLFPNEKDFGVSLDKIDERISRIL